ncbi:eCIS core domain-containing protein [Marinigracilibium pacificum]|uniref:DUF4157 domain-containing protein n=1 Tax=Marinigracilibium pacificum TaxID=2729599 RepID=A0A848IS32_9BACT|nr:DUF4157 domain-containing protein [Marinigracilibium pacificum]NMM47263.1 DUF4157 domain-containing protein [Marinigracilibium pacificum]
MHQFEESLDTHSQKRNNDTKSKLPANISQALKNNAPAPGTTMIQRFVKKGDEGKGKGEKSNNSPIQTKLPAEIKSNMEANFGVDFSNVKIFINDKSAIEIGALAYTQGDEIHFAPGHYNPYSPEGKKLLSHELTHVVQQRQGRVQPGKKQNKGGYSINSDQLLEREADLMSEKVATGKGAPPAMFKGASANSIQAKSINEELKEFRSKVYSKTNFSPATGKGLFDVSLNPSNGRLEIKIIVNFNFVNGTSADFAGLSGQSKNWTETEKKSWKNKFITLIEGRWGGKYHFINPKLPGVTVYTDVEIEESTSNWHYQLNVTKIPKNGFKGSSISHYTDSSGNALKQKNKHYGTLDSEDLSFINKGASQMQSGAIHEFGHMIGLGDEYNDGKSGITHAAMVQTALGQTLTEGTTNDIMSSGNTIEKQHYVTFLDALQKVTSDSSWKFKP